MTDNLTEKLAHRFRELRQAKGWSLGQLAELSSLSPATLSRIENATVSPTAEVLGRLSVAHGISISGLLAAVEDDYPALVRSSEQTQWLDKAQGFIRRSVSPPSNRLMAEVLHCELAPGAEIKYEAPSIRDVEHHLHLLSGFLQVTHGSEVYDLTESDCLRYHLANTSSFRTGEQHGAKYILVLVKERT